MKITPQVLDSVQNPAIFALRPDLEIDIPSFLHIKNPYEIARWTKIGIPELVRVFMTAKEFEHMKPIPEVFEMVQQGCKLYEEFLDNIYTDGQLLQLVDVGEISKIQLDPWKYIPSKFGCTESPRSKLLINLGTMKTWNDKRVINIIKKHIDDYECEKEHCKFHTLL